MEQVAALENNDKTWRILYGLYLQLDNIEGALATLENLSDTDENDHFQLIQEINLERLQSTTSAYELSEFEKLQLQEIAHSPSSERGHARALLSMLDDQTFWPEQNLELLEYSGGQLPIVAQETSNEILLKAFPNPAKNNIQLSLPYYFEDGIDVETYSISGILLQSHRFGEGQHLDIDVSSLSEGMYFLKVHSSDHTVGVVKVAVQ